MPARNFHDSFNQVADAQAAEEGDDYSQHRYGMMPMIQSQNKPDRTLIKVKDITPDKHQTKVWVRGRLHTSRSKGRISELHTKSNSDVASTHLRVKCASKS